MLVQVKRVSQGNNSTLSEIYIDGEFACYGLEDTVRVPKIKGTTAIPKGRYRLRLNTYGAMNARYKRRFPEMHRGMIEIADIPDFKYIYIHIGNNFGDTSGCLLVGSEREWVEEEYELRKSKKAYVKLYKLLIDAVTKGEAEVEVSDCMASI